MALTLGDPDTFSDAARNAQADSVDALVPAGNLVLRETNDSGTILVEYTLDNPAFGSASSGAIALSSAPDTVAAAAGTASTVARWQLRNSSDQAIMSGPVTGGDTISAGQDVTLTEFTITWPAAAP